MIQLYIIVFGRDVPDSGWPVLPAGNCVTGEYQYRLVLRLLITIYRKRLQSTDRGQWQHKRRLCVLILVPDQYMCPGSSDLYNNSATSQGCGPWVIESVEIPILYQYQPVFVTIITARKSTTDTPLVSGKYNTPPTIEFNLNLAFNLLITYIYMYI